jgi:hypothetical protein
MGARLGEAILGKEGGGMKRKEGGGMKRIIGVGIAAIVYSVVLPLAALAQDQDGSTLGEPEGPAVAGTGGSIGGADGTAFTGAEIAGLVLLGLVLLAVGFAVVAFSRRRPETTRIEA